MPKKRISVHLRPDLLKRIDEEATKQKRSRNNLIELTLEEKLTP